MAEIRIDASFMNNMVLILDCLSEDEMQTARHLFESLRDLQEIKLTGHCRYHRVSNNREFSEALQKIRSLCAGNWPILHVEGHGDEKGLCIGNAGERYSWDDLADEMRMCNAACTNNLGLVLAACHGHYLQSKVSATKGSPFNFQISCKSAMSAGDMRRHMVRFHSVLLQTASLDEACASLPKDLVVFRSHLYFLDQYGRHYKRMLIGRGRESAEERLLSDMTKNRFAKQHLGVNKLRKIARTVTTPFENRYIEQSRAFFHGQVPIPYEQFMEYLRDLPPPPEGFYDS
jgi:hypothetical protein